MSVLQGSLARTIGSAMRGLFYECSVIVTTPGEFDPENPHIEPQPTIATYPCRGMVDTFSDYQIANGLVEAGDRKVLILQTSLAIEPAVGMEVSIRGEKFTILGVNTDPAVAVWELRCNS